MSCLRSNILVQISYSHTKAMNESKFSLSDGKNKYNHSTYPFDHG